jgi:hypothetical protein
MEQPKSKVTKKERQTLVRLGGLGGKVTARRHGKGHMSTIGKAGAKQRWKKKR